jgi:hypothetical protein
MQQQHPDSSSAAEVRAATIKLVFKKALLSKLGHAASSAADNLVDDAGEAAPDTPKTAEKKIEKKSAPAGRKSVAKASASASKTAAPAKPSIRAAPHKPSKVVSKKATPVKQQKRSQNNVDAASITTELGRSVMSSTAGLDLADGAGESIPFSRVKRMMKEILGDLKLTNESVAAVICSCHGFLNYMTVQVLRLLPSPAL